MSRPLRSRTRRADRLGIALIAVLLAAGLLLGRGGLGALVRDARGAGESLLESVGTTRGADATSSPAAPVESLPTLGYLGEPPKPRLVYPHLRAGASGETQTTEHAFTFEGRTHTVTVGIDSEMYCQRRSKTEQFPPVENWTLPSVA